MIARRGDALALLASLVLHAGLAAYVAWRTSTPDLGFEFELPMEVEFGLTDAVTLAEGSAPAAPAPPSPAPNAGASASGEGPGVAADAGVPAPDAGPPDAGRRRQRARDAGPPAIAEGDDGEGLGDEGEGRGAEGERRGVAFLPAGSQIALRLDLARVRASPLSEDVRAVLRAMPDWQMLIGGAGIDPIDDMDRLLVASPNLERSRIVAAGRANGGESAIRAAAERLATAQGATLEWRSVRGVPVADWHDGDATDRVLALVGPSHFVIARPEDLPRVLAVARARAQRGSTEGAPEAPPQHPADALLSMEEGEGLSLEVEGFRNYARARPGQGAPLERLPLRLRLGLRELESGAVGVRIAGHFEDAAQAEAALGFWEEARSGYAPLARALGLGTILSHLRMRTEADVLRAEVDIQIPEMRRLLQLVRVLFEDRARAPAPRPPPPRAQPAEAPAPPGAPDAPPVPPPSPYE
ncbi:MAG TPA: hypothetical protein VIL20_15855 [Sandaracinaceae bacterium]